MFVVRVTYKKPLNEVDRYLAEHREFLEKGFQKNYFLISGPQNPRVGGIIVSLLKNRDQLEKIFENDPFRIHDIANYELIEFNPVKYHSTMTSLIPRE